jgi:hypothetical protein
VYIGLSKLEALDAADRGLRISSVPSERPVLSPPGSSFSREGDTVEVSSRPGEGGISTEDAMAIRDGRIASAGSSVDLLCHHRFVTR